MNEIKTFFNEQFGTVRTTKAQDGRVMFCAKDICDCLGIKNNKDAASSINDYERAEVGITDTSSNGTTQRRNMTFITESGVYKIAFKSRKKQAQQFVNWVTGELLPTYRECGAYATDEFMQSLFDNEDRAIEMFQELKARKERNKELSEQNAVLIAENDCLKPRAEKWDILGDAVGTVNIDEVAKQLATEYKDIGKTRLLHLLTGMGLLMKSRKGYMATQKAINMELFKVVGDYEDGEEKKYYNTVKVTPKGIKYIVEQYISYKEPKTQYCVDLGWQMSC